MKYILILSLILFTSLAQAQPFNQTDKQERKIGQWKKVYENGKTRYTGQFDRDKPVGEFRYYDTDGNLETVITHSADGHSATCVMYFNSKKIRAKGFYYDQKKDSLWTYYSEATQRVKAEERYYRGAKQGIWRIYYDSGQVFSEINYANDMKNGSWKEYFEDKSIRLSAFYDNDLLTGDYILYSLTGTVLSKGNYKDGHREGEWITYNDKGQKEHVEFIRDGWVYKEEFYKDGVLVETKKQASKIKED